MSKNKADGKKKKAFKPGSLAYVWNHLIHTPTAVFGMIIIVVLFILSFLTPYIFKYDYRTIDLTAQYAKPSLQHLLGCDDVGRDMLVRILYGAKYTLSIGFLSTGVGAALGIIIGAIAGYFGKMADTLIMRFLDIFQAFPSILLAITLAAIFGPGFWKIIIAMGLSGIPQYARMMRANIMAIRGQEYIEAAHSINCSTSRIIMKHVIPNAMGPVIVQIALGIASAGLAASSLSFLGFGVQPPTPEWGSLVSIARPYIRVYPHMCIYPGLFIMLTVVSYNLIGDAIRDALDPKLRD